MRHRWKLHLHENPFSQLAEFAQQLRSSGPSLGRDVQAESTNMATSLSYTASERGQSPGKFNLGWVHRGGGGGSGTEGPKVG